MAREKYTVYGYDAFGNPSQESVTIDTKSWWQRALWRVMWFLGIGRWRTISKITVRDE